MAENWLLCGLESSILFDGLLGLGSVCSIMRIVPAVVADDLLPSRKRCSSNALLTSLPTDSVKRQ